MANDTAVWTVYAVQKEHGIWDHKILFGRNDRSVTSYKVTPERLQLVRKRLQVLKRKYQITVNYVDNAEDTHYSHDFEPKPHIDWS
jgi:hypothetical protein